MILQEIREIKNITASLAEYLHKMEIPRIGRVVRQTDEELYKKEIAAKRKDLPT